MGTIAQLTGEWRLCPTTATQQHYTACLQNIMLIIKPVSIVADDRVATCDKRDIILT